MQYRFYLDGNLLQDEPKGWKELVTSITEYDEIRAILLTQDVTLSFIGDGYTYLYNIFQSDLVCALVELRIEYRCSSGFEEIFKGIVFITSLSFLNNECRTKVEDDSFFAKINNNKSIKAYLHVNRSKNGIVITPATETDVHFFNPCNCNYDQDRKAYTILEAFKYIVSFISDGEIGFVSNAFDTGGDWEGHKIATGWRLRDTNETDVRINPYLSFKDIFQEVNKKYNIGMSIEIIAGVPSIRIEPFTYFRTVTAAVNLNNPSNVEISTEISQLYAKIVVGSDKTFNTDSCSNGGYANFPENVNFVGFKEEEFPLLTECNLDTSLDLVSTWIISSNVIQEIIYAGNSQYDQDIVFLEVDPATDKMVSTDVFSDGNCYYNYFYSNFKSLERWGPALPNIVQVILGSQNNTFLAYKSTAENFSILISPVYQTTAVDGFGNPLERFLDDYISGNDPSNSYGTTVNPIVQVPQGNPVGTTESIFLVPTNGNYTFETRRNFSGIFAFFQDNRPVFFKPKVTINHYDSAGVLIQFYDNSTVLALTATPNFASLSLMVNTGVINCTAGDYVTVEVLDDIDFNCAPPCAAYRLDYTVDGTSYFACNFFQGFGGTLVRTINQNFANILFKFEYPLTYEQFKTIKSDTKKPISFNLCNKIYKAYIRDIKYNHHKNSKLTLIISKNGFRGN